MSKIALKPNASGTGVFSLEAPNSNVDRTLTLPDEAGSVLTDVSDIESQVKTATNATGSAPVYACRAWVNFDGTNTVSIRDSGNVSSITDNGTGDYIVNFTSSMPDVNYAPVFGTGNTVHFDRNDVTTSATFSGNPNVSFLEVKTHAEGSGSGQTDLDFINIAIFR